MASVDPTLEDVLLNGAVWTVVSAYLEIEDIISLLAVNVALSRSLTVSQYHQVAAYMPQDENEARSLAYSLRYYLPHPIYTSIVGE